MYKRTNINTIHIKRLTYDTCIQAILTKNEQQPKTLDE